MTADFRFPRTARVRARSDFDRIFKDGRRVALPVLALHWLASGPAPVDPSAPGPVPTEPRLGLAVSRKVDPHAVGRNRIKRTLRETFRTHRAGLAAADYVVVARPGAARLGSDELRTALLGLLRRAGAFDTALPLPALPGTMPPSARNASADPHSS